MKFRLTLVRIVLNESNRHSSVCLNCDEWLKQWRVGVLCALRLARFLLGSIYFALTRIRISSDYMCGAGLRQFLK